MTGEGAVWEAGFDAGAASALEVVATATIKHRESINASGDPAAEVAALVAGIAVEIRAGVLS